jgi:hypothetical protein
MNTNDTLPPESNGSATPAPGVDGLDESPEVCAAAEMLGRASAELKRAQELYDAARRQAAEKIEAVRKTTLGELIDGTVRTVRRHPGPSLILGALAGFWLGRLFRK